MKKIIIIISIILALAIIFVSFRFSGFIIRGDTYEDPHSWTKTICNETHCQSYVLLCNGIELINQTPITGTIIQIPLGWADPRAEIDQKRVCE
ncbi:MAG: hypothetical protein AABY32_06990 [Nanoarchaeota archaeon]